MAGLLASPWNAPNNESEAISLTVRGFSLLPLLPYPLPKNSFVYLLGSVQLCALLPSLMSLIMHILLFIIVSQSAFTSSIHP